MYRQQHDASAGADQPYQHFSATTPYGYSPFSANMSAVTEPHYHSSPHHLSPRLAMQNSPLRRRQGSLGAQAVIRQASRSMSPRFGSATPSRTIPFTPTDRSLPSKDVTADNITDAFVAFILYCNPNFPLDVDTQTLRTNFQSPPKSDNKEFEIFRLFELLRKFESKEIKTWGQLALDLGVEAPDVSKGQSVQKVQQYTVRLKRWMRAMHVDAFFDYLLGKDHVYFTEIPHPSEPHPPNGRDGVVAEEDLAIRALNPSFRPKRGRRRNSDVDQDDTEAGPASKQPRMLEEAPQILSATPHNMSMEPFSAHPSAVHSAVHDPWAVASAVTPQTFAPWTNKNATSQSAVSATGHSQFRWQLHENSHDPSTPHPMSAHPSTTSNAAKGSFEIEPKSAVTPSTRRRRKHGPAVSSAWPSTNGPNAKPRGRPPASRNVQDGPFSTFPADPASDKTTTSATTGQNFAVPAAQMEMIPIHEDPPHSAIPLPIARAGETLGRPGRLSLQVPPHTGGPVRLATPPRVLVNGETNDSDDHASQVSEARTYLSPSAAAAVAPTAPDHARAIPTVENEMPGFAFETLKRSLVSDLLRAELIGRRHRLNGDEAKRLADAVLERFHVPRAATPNPRDDIARLTAASWLGLGEHFNVPLGPAIGHNKRINVTRFRLDNEGYEEIAAAYDDSPGEIREVFDLSWVVSLGGCNGNFELKGLSLSPELEPEEEATIHDRVVDTWLATAKQFGIEAGHAAQLRKHLKSPGFVENVHGVVGEDGVDWKSKYRALEFGTKMAKGEFDRFRNRVIEKLLDAVIS